MWSVLVQLQSFTEHIYAQPTVSYCAFPLLFSTIVTCQSKSQNSIIRKGKACQNCGVRFKRYIDIHIDTHIEGLFTVSIVRFTCSQTYDYGC